MSRTDFHLKLDLAPELVVPMGQVEVKMKISSPNFASGWLDLPNFALAGWLAGWLVGWLERNLPNFGRNVLGGCNFGGGCSQVHSLHYYLFLRLKRMKLRYLFEKTRQQHTHVLIKSKNRTPRERRDTICVTMKNTVKPEKNVRCCKINAKRNPTSTQKTYFE